MEREATVKDICSIFGFSEVWIRQLAQQGKIPATKLGSHWRFNEKEVQSALCKNNSYFRKVKE